jgi:hypothetical protein
LEESKYNDPHFKPDMSSLMNKHTSLDTKTVKLWKQFVWKRASELFPHTKNIRPEIFEDGVEMEDIKQGALGNCYFLSALAALAIKGQRIKDLFVTKEFNEAGIYVVRFYINGKQQNVTIDDYFPFDPRVKRPAFSQTNDNELWVLILEKAWAKINGSYENTISGQTNDALSFLLPAPSTVVDH